MKLHESDDSFEDILSSMNLSKLVNALNSLPLQIKHKREIDRIKRKSKKLGINVYTENYQGNGHREIFSELLSVLQDYYDLNNKVELFRKNKEKQNFTTTLTIKRRDKSYSSQELIIKLWLDRFELILLRDREEFSTRLMGGKHRIAIEDVIISSEKNSVIPDGDVSKTGRSYYMEKTSNHGFYEIDLRSKMIVTFGLGGTRSNQIWSNGKFSVYLEEEIDN
ncbi:hypothetical protein [Lewinella sp. LCG006]|uniref:hypothetical protein n=1 Tax=Lewinella sp. LCG006 TaxID=3231911 RepID=UPI00345FB571